MQRLIPSIKEHNKQKVNPYKESWWPQTQKNQNSIYNINSALNMSDLCHILLEKIFKN